PEQRLAERSSDVRGVRMSVVPHLLGDRERGRNHMRGREHGSGQEMPNDQQRNDRRDAFDPLRSSLPRGPASHQPRASAATMPWSANKISLRRSAMAWNSGLRMMP